MALNRLNQNLGNIDDNTTNFANLYVNGFPSGATIIGLKSQPDMVSMVIRADSAQTSDLTQWQNSAGTAVTRIDAAGNIVTSGTITASGLISAGYFTQNTAGAYANQWTKIASISLLSQYADSTILLDFINANSSVTDAARGRLYLRVKQQNAMGGVPQTPTMTLYNSGYFATSDFALILTQNDTVATSYDLYVKDTLGYNSIFYTPVMTRGISWTFYSNQAFSASLPSNLGVTNASFAPIVGGSGVITVGSGATVGLSITGANPQTADLQQWRTSTPLVVAGVSSSGYLYTGSTSVLNTSATVAAVIQSSIQTSAVGTIGQVIRGTASQTANLQEWQSSTSAVLSKITSAGVFSSPLGLIITAGVSYFNAAGDANGSFISSDTGRAQFAVNNAAVVPVTVRGAASQAVNLQDWQTSTPTTVASVDQTGAIQATAFSNKNYVRIVNPGGAEWSHTTGTVTGALAITFPVGGTNSMLSMTVKIYEYVTNESFEVKISGYNYATGNTWANNPTAYIIGNPGVDRQFTVRLGYTAGGKMVAYIGELASTWSYPQVFVTDIQLGYGGSSAAWLSGWSIGAQASAFENVTATITASQVGRQATANTASTLALRDASGNFAAGVITANNYKVSLTTGASDTVALDFTSGNGLITRAAAAAVTFTGANYSAGSTVTVRIVAGAAARAFTFPAGWVFVGSKPTQIAASKSGILTVTSFGTTEADCIASWVAQL